MTFDNLIAFGLYYLNILVSIVWYIVAHIVSLVYLYKSWIDLIWGYLSIDMIVIDDCNYQKWC